MPISALIITLDDRFEHAERGSEHVLGQLAAREYLELGAVSGRRVPAVADTPSSEAGHALVAQLQQMPGVLQVDVLSIYFDDER